MISATTDDAEATVAFGDHDWRDEVGMQTDVFQYFIAEVHGRPVGVVGICDPHLEPTHYWGEIEPGLRAIDIWIGSPDDRGRGLGRAMMELAHHRCFADPAVAAIVIDPLVSNTRAIAFYRRLGYVDVGPRQFGEDNCLVMRLDRHQWQQRQ